ncbi:MAG: hypothetical protein HYV28_07480 [Ignavibacteriales bacterium]|nr:hypothetical protein [Ignavibacteriales bacterium]
MFKKYLLFITFILLSGSNFFSQTPSYYHYTSSDGLASSTVFEIIQEKSGFIWFATLNGISRFDGQHFSTFRTPDGLNSNSIISLVEGKNGELYFGNYEKGINVLKNGRIENYCNEIGGKSFALSYLLLTVTDNDEQLLYAYRRSGDINSILQKNNGELLASVNNIRPVFINNLEKLQDGNIIALAPDGLFSFKNNLLSKLKIKELPDIGTLSFTNGDDNSYFVGAKAAIYQIKNNQVIKRYSIHIPKSNNDVVALLFDKNKNLWFSIMNQGFFCIPAGSKHAIDIGVKIGLQSTLVNNYLEDNEGNIWISTFGKGVYCLTNLQMKHFSENDGISNNCVYAIEKDRTGKFVIGTFNGVNIMSNGDFIQVKCNSGSTQTEYIYEIRSIDNELYVCGAFGGSEKKSITRNGVKFFLINQPSFCKTKDGQYLFGNAGNFITVQKELIYKSGQAKKFFIMGDSANTNRINKIFEDTKSNIWVGTGLGLCKIKSWQKNYYLSDPVLNARISAIFQDSEQNVWFGGEKGIACFNLKNGSMTSYTTLPGIDLSSSTSFASDNKHRLWIGNMKGLYVFDGKFIKHLNKQSNLPSNEVFSLYFDSFANALFIGSSNGICRLDIGLFDNQVTPPIELKIIRIKAGDSVYSNTTQLEFTPEQNNVSVNFIALCFSSPGSVIYKYKLDTTWVETKNGFLDFISLKAGKYELQIMAKAQNTEWSKPYYLSFRVLPRFFETVWFPIVIVFLLSGISVAGMSWRMKLNQKKTKQDIESNERTQFSTILD